MMYGAAPMCALPWSADRRDLRVYCDMTMDLSAELTLKIYVTSSAGYATEPTDTPANQPFRGVLKSFSFSRSIMQGDIGRFTTGTGNLKIDNADAEYDFLQLSYAIDGRPIAIRIGRPDQPYAETYPLAKLTATGWNVDTDAISIDLVDYSYKLEVPMQPHTYGGTGGANGGADLTGKRKPLVFGNAQNISPVLLVPNLLIYQAHDGAMQSIDAVYDRGVPLTGAGDVANYAALAAASVTSGQFKTCLAAGLLKLGSSANGTVTADVKGDATDGYLVRTADIVRWALRHRTVLSDPVDLSVLSFDQVNLAQPAPIDYFIGPDDNLTVAAFIDNIMGGIGGWGGHRLDGTFEVRIFQAPSGSPADAFTRADMLGGDIKKEPLPESYRPPRWRWRVPYQRCWTVQTDLAGAVTAARKAFVAEPYRLAEATSSTIQLDHPFAQDRDPVQSYFSQASDAAAEAARLIDLFKTTRAIYRMSLPRRALRREMGDVISVTHERFDLRAGRLMVVLEWDARVEFENGGMDTVEIAAYG
ncbi:hypothetical protein IVB45_17555 [Bradyrhizobium sp. 4]|uniref:hypothetical protein n=1 Tax=unclassified Bradyrhizobium TaxID=2631580 RepID=UPI001FF744B2|nr:MULTISPECIES: hypothetical protein [unclassified Bradyrhizobium]MCK1402018.1 hypothetical protein [Bradyrhizobium sp. 39]MCK1751262.1 hypothetical protein [Bradyrhizobium sp. 135]UPJ38515.1 hypothetical protein IVB45_17555 [Bradyrhizobium sp. 4]